MKILRFSVHLLAITSLLASSSFILSGCENLQAKNRVKSHNKKTDIPSFSNSIKIHEKYAKQYQDQDKLPEALIQWKILATINPDSLKYQKYIVQTTALIRERAEKHMRTAVSAFENNDTNQARIELLKSLSYDASQPFPKRYLEETEYELIRNMQTAKYTRIKEQRQQSALSGKNKTHIASSNNEQEFQYLEQGIRLFRDGELRQSIFEITKFLNSYPDDPLAKQYISDAYMGMAMKLLSSNNHLEALAHFEKAQEFATDDDKKPKDFISKTRKLIADDFYEKGQRIFNKDADKAIEYWKRSIEYDPQHTNAKLRLRMALKIKEKLKSIN